MLQNKRLVKLDSVKKIRKHSYKLKKRYKRGRSVYCLFCKSTDVKKNGKYHYIKYVQRYYCKKCKRSFSDTTKTILHHRKISNKGIATL